ncbi:TRC40/GET3/ArsA family transport-energizing ATPase [Microbacterium excoecariae]|uniref:TRC40/GET3/ArsA family transport-energizing ATPase n=1 Tax=Microbacterium excoecariae TaxID=2715210 RepID=UPI00140A6CE6|nr:ArsA family ATPase [Microbacterium excoecariae]
MLLNQLAGRRALFVGGKGGVGKTSVASALALAAARGGERVLVVSTDPAHNLGHLWERPVGERPTPLWRGAGRVDGIEIDPAATVERHLAAVGSTMTRLLPERLHGAARAHLEAAREAPGTHESAALEAVADALAMGLAEYDRVVFDTAPSGHTLHLLASPERMTTWAENLLSNRDRSERFSAAYGALGGTRDTSDRDAELRRVLRRRRERFAAMRDALADPRVAGFVLVFVPEPLPIAESREVAEELARIGIPLVAAVANRLSPEALPARRAREEALLAGLDLGAPVTRVPLVDDLVGLPALDAIGPHLGGPDRQSGPSTASS